MKGLKAVLAGNEISNLNLLAESLRETAQVEILNQLSNPQRIEGAILKYKPNVVFIEMDLPNNEGLALIKNLIEYHLNLSIVLVTNSDKIDLPSKQRYFYYLHKPYSKRELNELINRLLFHKENIVDLSNKVKLPIKNGYLYLKYDDILMLKAEGNYTNITTITNETYISSYNMGRLHSKLPRDVFFRINRGCILNSTYLREIDKKQNVGIVIVNGNTREFDISHTFIRQFKKEHLSF